MAPDPLFETLFRSTAPAPAIASAAPVRAVGTRARAGNAMNRTRGALLEGARRAVAVNGTKITMAQVAAAAGVAKATLYNHFRTRDAVLAALLRDEIDGLVRDFGDLPLPEALGGVANALAKHPLLRTLARLEPATLAVLGCVDVSADGWRQARDSVAQALAAHSLGGTDTVLRRLASYLITPAGSSSVAADLAVIVAGLPPTAAEQAAARAAAEESEIMGAVLFA
jgi:AcrR family transcriptional regulator